MSELKETWKIKVVALDEWTPKQVLNPQSSTFGPKKPKMSSSLKLKET